MPKEFMNDQAVSIGVEMAVLTSSACLQLPLQNNRRRVISSCFQLPKVNSSIVVEPYRVFVELIELAATRLKDANFKILHIAAVHCYRAIGVLRTSIDNCAHLKGRLGLRCSLRPGENCRNTANQQEHQQNVRDCKCLSKASSDIHVCRTPTLTSATSGFSDAASSACVIAWRVSMGSMILSIQRRAAPWSGSCC